MNDVLIGNAPNVIPVKAGDIGFQHGKGFGAWWIRYGEGRKYGRDSREAMWCHNFLFADDGYNVIESIGRGVVKRPFNYDTDDICVVRPIWKYENQPAQVVEHMMHLLNDRYSYIQLVSEGLRLLTGTKLIFGKSGEYICSGSVATSLASTGIDMGPMCEFNTPADNFSIALTRQMKYVGGIMVVGLS